MWSVPNNKKGVLILRMEILILVIDGPSWYLYKVCLFALCKNYIVNCKVVFIFMLCQICDFSEAPMGKE